MSRSTALPSDVKLVTVSSESGERDNAAVTGLKLRPAVPVVGEEALVVAEVWNGSPPISDALPVTLTATMEDADADAAPDDLAEPAALSPAAPSRFPWPFRKRVVTGLWRACPQMDYLPTIPAI